MRLLYKIAFSMATLVLLPIVGACGWFFLYTRDLPNLDRLSQFAPSAPSVVSDSCLDGPSTVVPFERIGKPFRDAFAAAEPARPLPAASLPDRIAGTLLCNQWEGQGKLHLDALRLSWHIRMHFSEQQIFTIYANRAYFGPGAIGIENASRKFFQKDADALSIEEAALIAGLLRAPGYFSPYDHPEKALQRRNKVLQDMVAQGRLSASDAARAEATPVITQ